MTQNMLTIFLVKQNQHGLTLFLHSVENQVQYVSTFKENYYL